VQIGDSLSEYLDPDGEGYSLTNEFPISSVGGDSWDIEYLGEGGSSQVAEDEWLVEKKQGVKQCYGKVFCFESTKGGSTSSRFRRWRCAGGERCDVVALWGEGASRGFEGFSGEYTFGYFMAGTVLRIWTIDDALDTRRVEIRENDVYIQDLPPSSDPEKPFVLNGYEYIVGSNSWVSVFSADSVGVLAGVQVVGSEALYLGATNPSTSGSISGAIWVSEDCTLDGDMTLYTEEVEITAAYISSPGGAPISNTTSTGEYSLGGITASTCGTTLELTHSGWAPSYTIIKKPDPVIVSYNSPHITGADFVLCHQPPDWMQCFGGDVFAKTINMEIPLGISLTDRIPFASGNTIMCEPGRASSFYGDGIHSYGDYNHEGAKPWPFTWNFEDSTDGFSDLTGSAYGGLVSGRWYFDTPGHFKDISQYSISGGKGVAYVVVRGDVLLNGTFKKPNPNAPEGLVVFVAGDLTIPEGVGSDTNYSLEALFVVNGNIIVKGAEDMLVASGQLKVKGGFYIKERSLIIDRKFGKADREANPLLIIDADPTYWLYENDSELSRSPIYWEEI
jgi:hypothetical protein